MLVFRSWLGTALSVAGSGALFCRYSGVWTESLDYGNDIPNISLRRLITSSSHSSLVHTVCVLGLIYLFLGPIQDYLLSSVEE